MKATTIIYWITTIFFSVMMIFSGYLYLTVPEMKSGFEQLGFTSDSFRIELAIAKFIGALVLLQPFVKGNVKEWAYAGFSIVMVSATIAHYASGDPMSKWIAPLVGLVILSISYFCYHLSSPTASK